MLHKIGCVFLNVASVQVVEITKGSKVKYELDKKTGLIKVIHPVSSYDKLNGIFSMHQPNPTQQKFSN